MATVIRDARETDFQTISQLIVENADYTGSKAHLFQSSEQLIEDCLNSSPPKFYCLVSTLSNCVVGYTIYNQAYSTWVGRTMNIQDFYVAASYRSSMQDWLMKHLVGRAQEMGCRRIAWLASNKATEYNEFWTKHGGLDITVGENWHQYRLEATKFQDFIDRCS